MTQWRLSACISYVPTILDCCQCYINFMSSADSKMSSQSVCSYIIRGCCLDISCTTSNVIPRSLFFTKFKHQLKVAVIFIEEDEYTQVAIQKSSLPTIQRIISNKNIKLALTRNNIDIFFLPTLEILCPSHQVAFALLDSSFL